MFIVLDTFPTSSVTRSPDPLFPTLSDQCHLWINDCGIAGHRVLVTAISYYEALRELELRQASSQINRLREFYLKPHRFLPLTVKDIDLAAQLWGQSRRAGRPTADPHALDGDVILAAQALNLRINAPGLIVATTNPEHLSRYVPADLWMNIHP